jgi:phosphatidate cytidylyltransferase
LEFNFTRILNGLLVLSIITFFYIYNFDYLFFILIIIFIFYDFYKSKFFQYFLLIDFYLLFVITSFIIYFFSNTILFQLILFYLFTILSVLTNLKLKNILFIIILFLFLNLLFFSIDFNRSLFFITIFISFINDSLAYLFGNLLKGPKIIPSISPKKTWSGTIISMTVSSFILMISGYNFLFSILISIMFFLGDIYFSIIKRSNHLKDFSNLIPGHGGFLDRLDSIIFSFTLIFTYKYYIL